MDNGAEFYPKAIYDALHNLRDNFNVNVPVFITENGTYNCEETPAADGGGVLRVHDVTRMKYIRGFLSWLKKAIDEGIDVRGYYLWTLLDNFEWTAGNSMRFGLVRCDYGADNYILKDSAYMMKEFLK